MLRILSFFAAAILLTSCEPGISGNGKVKSEVRELDDFDALDISGGFEVHIAQTGESGFRLEADENLHQYIETYVEKGVLYVSSTRRISHSKEMDLYINLKDLNGIESSGACEFNSRGTISGKRLNLDFSGAVEADLELAYEMIYADCSGAAELNLSGKADEVRVDGSGAVEIKALNLESRVFSLDLSGAGEAEVYVTEELNIDASGAVEVRYKGDPEKVNRDVSGAASIKPI